MRQAWLLLVLSAALLSSFLLLDFLVSLVSTAPRDILSVNPSSEEFKGLPTGVTLVELATFSVSIVLALFVLISPSGWPVSRSSFRLSPSFALRLLAAAALVAAGTYLAFSGTLVQRVFYDQHLVEGSLLEMGALAVLALIFFSLAIAGIVNRKLLASVLAVWLVAGVGFGLLDVRSLDGLDLFERADRLEPSAQFASLVDRYTQASSPVGDPESGEALDRPQSGVAAPDGKKGPEAHPGARKPVFRVLGSAHTRYLRVATGDVYDMGEWQQLEAERLPVGPGVAVAEAVRTLIQRTTREILEGVRPEAPAPALLAYPPTSPLTRTNRILVLPPDDSSQIQAGAVPISKHPLGITTTGAYDPFSATLTIPEPVSHYEWWASVPDFAVTELVDAATTDETYLQLPDDLPERVHQVAEQFRVSQSPFLNATLIMLFLEGELTYVPDEPGVEPDQIQEGSDGVDHLLFELRAGGSRSFSSAFVVLARAAGIPARVVSGWVVRETEAMQFVYEEQSHQWAEIALDGVGWFTFDPGALASRVQAFEAPTLEASLEQLAEDTDPSARAEAAEALGLIGGAAVLPGLMEALEKDPDMDVRVSALTSVQRLGFEALARILLNHEDLGMRATAARALSTLRDLRALEPLLEALFTDVAAEVRAEAALALEHVGKHRAEEQLLLAASGDGAAVVREAAVRTLGRLKTAWTARQVAVILGSDIDSRVRTAAAWALGQIGNAVALGPLLQARSEDAAEAVREAAADALGRWGSPELLSILQESDQAAERAAAAVVLGEREYVDAIPALGIALHDPNDEVRRAAVAALDSMGDLTWLENGTGLLRRTGHGIALIPGTTAEMAGEAPPTPVFELEGRSHTSLLRVSVGDSYADGKWLPNENPGVPLNGGDPIELEADVEPTLTASSVHWDEISISSAVLGTRILPGSAPISLRLESVFQPGTYWPDRGTYVLSGSRSSFAWVSEIHDFATETLNAADGWPTAPEHSYADLPDRSWLQRARELAARITAGESTVYGKARAIEQFLKSEYTYRTADSGGVSLPPPGRDPVDWFLFESREGTSGSFSSAFVILARSAGIPARVVSGWAIVEDSESQTICSDQAHQWAEVAFDGPGWVSFDPTPGGAPSRVGLRCDPAYRQAALEEVGNGVIRLENGSVLTGQGGQAILSSGTTTRQSPEPPHIPVFDVSGAANTGYLRTGVGEVYREGGWGGLDPIGISYTAGENVPDTVRREYSSQTGMFAWLPENRRETESLFGLIESPNGSYHEQIRISPAGEFTELPAGPSPTSLHLQSTDRDGAVYPFSSTFHTNEPMATFSWTSEVPSYSAARHALAIAASDPTYTQLPRNLPERIRELALRITAGHDTTYAKAKALEQYLSTNYTYRFADGSGRGDLPLRRDPVDWFLFDHREGTCGVFSSAFVVLARSVGIPARVVSGWAISPTEGRQTVFLDQAHQWAEVPFEGLGWVTFEPTASGPPSRADRAAGGGASGGESSESGAPSQSGEANGGGASGGESSESGAPSQSSEANGGGASGGGESSGSGAPSQSSEANGGGVSGGGGESDESIIPSHRQDTLTTITQWPAEVRREQSFIVGGTVTTEDGRNISGLEIEIYVNETKEHGGILVGTAVTTPSGYTAEVLLPAHVELGSYQLLARARGNDRYNESWSDPDITVYSGSGLELTGPSEVTVDVEATFQGRLLEDTGRGVAGQELIVLIDGSAAPSVLTDSSGQYSFSRTFSSTGPHWVEVQIRGGEFLLDSKARLNFLATLPTETVLHAPALVEVGEEFRVTGELHDVRGSPLGGQYVVVQVGDGPEQTVVTDGEGHFEFTGSVYATGEFTARARFERNGSVLSSNGTSRLSSQHGVVLTINGPGFIEEGQGATFVGRLESDTFSPVGELELTLKNSLGQETFSITTDEDGRFEYHNPSFQNTGPHSLIGRFAGGDYVGSSTAGIAFRVAAPTLLTLRGPKGVREGESFEVTGILLQRNGRAVPNAEVQVAGEEPLTLVTDANGRFSWEAVAELDRSLTEGSAESGLLIELDFAGTDHLGPSSASLEVAVGLPRIVVEDLEPVARGDMAALRGMVLVGNLSIADVALSIGPDVSLRANDVGAFTYDYLVSPNTPLGTSEVEVSAAELDVSVIVPIQVMSAPSLTFAQAEEPAPGGSTLLSATLVDDRGAGISGAALRSSQGVEAVTDDLGVALIEVRVPDSEDLAVVPVTFMFDGDDRNAPLTESFVLAVQPAPTGVNWLLLVGIAALIALLVTAGFARRRLSTLPVPEVVRRWSTAVRQGPRSTAISSGPGGIEDETAEAARPSSLEVHLIKAAQDLPDVWGAGEEVLATIRLADGDGQGVGGGTVSVSIIGVDAAWQLTTDEQGGCAVSWSGGGPGAYRLSAEYEGNDVYLPSSASRTFRVVEFKEEIVHLYNLFLDWAGKRSANIKEHSTPREVELILVSEGLPVDQKSLDELISRFEEADYSEHPISRRHYEAMHRAWRMIVGAEET